jgi:hypothetical protein
VITLYTLGAQTVDVTPEKPTVPNDNVALNKPSWQSSVYRTDSREPPGSQFSGGGNNGVRTGTYGFHTLYETQPWWIVDLLAPHVIGEIRVYNRCDHPLLAGRANALDILASRDGNAWITLFSYRRPEPFGLDGKPLIVTVTDKTPYRLVKLQLRNDDHLHLGEVEIYGHPVDAATGTGPAVPMQTYAPAPPADVARVENPVIHINTLNGALANRMLQYMAALRLQALVPSAVLSNVQLAEWRVEAPTVMPGKNDRVLRVTATDQFDIPVLAEKLRKRDADFVMIEDYVQDISFFPDPERYRREFVPGKDQVADLPGFARDELIINVRAAEVLDGIVHYPLVPIGFYRDVVQSTGLRPVIMGQVEPSFYCEELLNAFPQARVIPSQGAIRDFEMIRSAHNIVPSVSSFSWLGAFLSHASVIHLPVTGFYNPAMVRNVDLLALHDPRFRYYLFPLAVGLPERETLRYHTRLGRAWWQVPASQLAFIKSHAPFLPRAGRSVPEIDAAWYLHEYIDAAREITEGWYDNVQHHFDLVGASRGYLPQRPPQAVPPPLAPVAANATNLARNRPARQSSLSPGHSVGKTVEADAARAVDGVISETYRFRTAEEHQPWWQVDLGAVARIDCVVLYNPVSPPDAAWRALPIAILLSDDGLKWRMAYRSRANEVFGGADGKPLRWQPETPTRARYVSVQATRRTTLHLSQVEVFGSLQG